MSTTTPAAASCLLVGEAFSPWTQKARWALAYCGVAHGYREYTPTLDEPWLRWRLRAPWRPVSVPVLFTVQAALEGSWDIAVHAAVRGGDRHLVDLPRIRAWNRRSDDALAEGRARLLQAMLDDDHALEESLPAAVPQALRPALRSAARAAVHRLSRKYAHLARPGALRHRLLQTRDQLRRRGGEFLLGRFSYADIAMAVVLEMVAPAADLPRPLGIASRRCWSDPTLADEFADLLLWRQRLASDPAIAPPWLHAVDGAVREEISDTSNVIPSAARDLL